jgi:hypothetical protein
MNPCRKFPNHNLDNTHSMEALAAFLSTLFIVSIVIFCVVILNPIHKKNIAELKETKPLAQQYTLNQSDPIWFYKSDEIGWTRGEVIYLWGYHPVIFSKDLNKTFKFNEVEWTNRYE